MRRFRAQSFPGEWRPRSIASRRGAAGTSSSSLRPVAAAAATSTARPLVLLWVFLLAGSLVGSPALAQSRTTSGLEGRVTDEAGLPLRGAVVRIASPALIGGLRSAVTDEAGRFRFKELPLGGYGID